MATIKEIKQQAAAVKNATQVGENTAERVGGALSGLADIAKQQEVELGKKFDKESISQEFGDSNDKVMSQKATTTAIADEVARAKAAEGAIIFDVSANNNDAVFESLQALLSSSDLSTIIPTSVRHGGMGIRFIQGSLSSSDNKYVQYRLMSDEFTTDTTQWAIAEEGIYVENPEYIYVKTDKEGKIIWAIKTDGSIHYGTGVPQQVKDYIEKKIADLSLDEYEDIVAFLTDYLGNDTTLKALINGINERIPELTDSPEYLQITTDQNSRILKGIKKDGTVFVVNNQEIDGDTTVKGEFRTPMLEMSPKENQEWIQVTTDNGNRILRGRDKHGFLIEYVGLKTPFLFVKEANIGEVGASAVFVKDHIELSNKAKNQLKNDVSSSIWKNKKIWWCGTSIPAGGYPQIVGSNLGCTVYNEAVGGSGASSLMHLYQSFYWNTSNMGHSVLEELAILEDCYNIDWENKTVSQGTGSLYHMTNVDTCNSWSDFINVLLRSLCFSYQIKLVSKYLIEDTTEWDAYMQYIFGEYDWSTFKTLFTDAQIAQFQFREKIDLFVIDHSVNDEHPTSVNLDSVDMTTYVGAINTYIKLIRYYNPFCQIVMVSPYYRYNYDRANGYPVDNTNSQDIVQRMQDIADHWEIPLFNMTEYLPLTSSIKVTTSGYWDKNNQVWHNRGFEWSESGDTFNTNAFLTVNGYVNNNVATMKAFYNPRYDEQFGCMVYDTYPRFIFMRDGLHPHNNGNTKLLEKYAEQLSQLLNNISKGY